MPPIEELIQISAQLASNRLAFQRHSPSDRRTREEILDSIQGLEAQKSDILNQIQSFVKTAGLENDVNLQNLIKQASGTETSGGSPVAAQALQERFSAEQQRVKEQTQLGEFRTGVETQLFGAPGATLEQALASPTSELGQLQSTLREQERGVFREELKPLIEQGLGARGLLDSGANVELQSKALGQLERGRQGMLSQAFFGGKEQLRGLQQSDIMGDIGARRQALSESFGLQRAGMSMSYQRELEQQRMMLARELAQLSGGGGGFNLGGAFGTGIAGAGLGFQMGGPWGAAAGFGAGFLGGGAA